MHQEQWELCHLGFRNFASHNAMVHYDYLSSDLYPVTAFFPVNREMRWQIRFFLSAGTNYICVKKLAKEIRALHHFFVIA